MPWHYVNSLIFFIIGLAAPSQSAAECSSEPNSRYQTFRAEKKWPLHPELIIRVSASFQEGSSITSPESEMGFYDLYVELVSLRTKKSVAEFCDEGALASDAMALVNISIDTAPYILSKSTHAFGVRTSYRNNSGSNPASTYSITLFGVTTKKIRRLLETMEMGGSFNEISYIDDCQRAFMERQSSIALGETNHRGLVDLIVLQHQSEGKDVRSGKDCVETTTSKKLQKRILVFDGVQYK